MNAASLVPQAEVEALAKELFDAGVAARTAHNRALGLEPFPATYDKLTDDMVAAWVAIARRVLEQRRVLHEALERSVRLQSHYAQLLNAHDGGERLQFAGADDWIGRLLALNAKEGVAS